MSTTAPPSSTVPNYDTLVLVCHVAAAAVAEEEEAEGWPFDGHIIKSFHRPAVES